MCNVVNADTLLLAFQSLGGHFNQAVLGFGIREMADGLNSLLGIPLCKGTGLLNAVTREDNLTCL